MRPIDVVLAYREPVVPERLVQSISKQFHNSATAHNAGEVRTAVARLGAGLAIVDLELIHFPELGELCRDFPATAFVCTHRLADDAMWLQSLAMGAVDCCLAGDLPKILLASERYVAIKEAQTPTAA
jgi:hypothetical protein